MKSKLESRKAIRLVILPEACNKEWGGYMRGNIYYPKVGCYYGYIEPCKPKEKEEKDEK